MARRKGTAADLAPQRSDFEERRRAFRAKLIEASWEAWPPVLWAWLQRVIAGEEPTEEALLMRFSAANAQETREGLDLLKADPTALSRARFFWYGHEILPPIADLPARWAR